MIVTEQYLKEHPECIFVFGDNLIRKGTGGAAKLRHLPNTYGFITKKYPDTRDASYYTAEEYKDVFKKELRKLEDTIDAMPNNVFLITKLGAGLANKFGIWEKVIKNSLRYLHHYKNVKLLFEEE